MKQVCSLNTIEIEGSKKINSDKLFLLRMKKSSVLFTLFIVSSYFNVFSQEPLTHEKKTYVSPEGKTYVNKDLPLYMWFSTSPAENSKKHILKGERTSRYSNPMYLDSEGKNTLRSPSAVDTVTKKIVMPLRDIEFELYADSKAPVTSLEIDNTTIFKSQKKMYISGEAEVTLSSRDETSGVENIYYSINGSPYEIYQSLKLDDEKEYDIKYYAVDHVGNAEKVKSAVIVVDKSSPVSVLEVKGDKFENIISGRSGMVIKTEDKSSGIAGIYYKIDNSPFRLYLGEILAANILQGDHKITYYAVDKVKNKETEQTFDFYVDKMPPNVIEEIVGKTFIANGREYSSGSSKLKLTAFDNKAGVKGIYYSINGEPYKLYEKPVQLFNSKGNLVVKSYAIDNVNNKSEGNAEEGNQSKSISYVDLTGPTLNHSFKGPIFVTGDTVFINQETKISILATDNESGLKRIDYQVDGDTMRTYDKPFSILNEGNHNIKVIAYDNVDNLNNTNIMVSLDNTGPMIFERFSTLPNGTQQIESKQLDTYPPFMVLFLSATDINVGYDNMYYKVNDQPFQMYNGQIKGFSQEKPYTVVVKAIDKLGNETEKIIQFVIKNK